MGENEPWLLVGTPNRDPLLVTQNLERNFWTSDQHMKKLMSMREGLHVMTRCYMRHHFAYRYWLHQHSGGHLSWREPAMRKWNIQKMLSESSEHVRKTTDLFTNSSRIKTALENYFEEHAKEVWQRSWMNPEMQTTLLNTYPPKSIATIFEGTS